MNPTIPLLTTAMRKALVDFRDHGNPYHSVIGLNTRTAREEAVQSLLKQGYVSARENCITEAGKEVMRKAGL